MNPTRIGHTLHTHTHRDTLSSFTDSLALSRTLTQSLTQTDRQTDSLSPTQLTHSVTQSRYTHIPTLEEQVVVMALFQRRNTREALSTAHVCVCVCVCVYVYEALSTAYVYVCVFMCVCIYVCMYVCVCIDICT